MLVLLFGFVCLCVSLVFAKAPFGNLPPKEEVSKGVKHTPLKPPHARHMGFERGLTPTLETQGGGRGG